MIKRNFFASRDFDIDLLRGFSVLLVITTHGLFSLNWLGFNNFLNQKQFATLRDNGYLGVSIFFVISGFLITRQILRGIQFDKDGKFNNIQDRRAIPHFYKRRISKIYPPLLTLFAITFLFSLMPFPILVDFAAAPYLTFLAFSHAMTFSYNEFYLGLGGSSPGLRGYIPLWSLSIEEVYYILWPIVLNFLRDRRILYIFLITIIIFSPAYRSENGLVSIYHLFGCADMLAMGSLTALLGSRNSYSRGRNFYLLKVSLLCMIFILLISLEIKSNYVIAPALVGILTSLYILTSINSQGRYKSSLGRIVKFLISPLGFLGILSYEIYLFHLVFFMLFFRLDYNFGLNTLSSIVPTTSLIICCFVMHFYLFEPIRGSLFKEKI